MHSATGIVMERTRFRQPSFTRVNSRAYGIKTENIQNPAITGVAPKGYMTLEEFRNIEIEKTKLFCIENDIH